MQINVFLCQLLDLSMASPILVPLNHFFFLFLSSKYEYICIKHALAFSQALRVWCIAF